jgi:hypothetical protein
MIWRVQEPADLHEGEETLRASISTGAKAGFGTRAPGEHGEPRPGRSQIRAETISALLRAPEAAYGPCAALWVEGAHITGALDLRHARLGIPLIMKHCYFDGPVDLSEARAVSVSLAASRFPSFRGYGLQVDGDVDCAGCHGGQIDIFGARIGGRLWLAGAELDGTGSGYALNAPDLAVDGGMYCRELRAVGVNLFGATIGSTLEFDGAALSSQDGPALRAPGLSVKADMRCGSGFTATSVVDIFGAQIGGQLWFNDARLDGGDSRRALSAPQICVGGGAYFNGQFSASGMINLFGAVIGSTLEFGGASLGNPQGKCLRAPGLAVKASVSFTGGFTASGEIDLAGSRIGGELELADTTFTGAVMDLRGAAAGELRAAPASLPGRLHINGLTYTALQPYLPAAQRLEILRRDEDGYQPQPYEQLAAHYRTLGYDEQARTVLLAKQRCRRRGLSPGAKAWGYLQDAGIGYGYRPARALLWLIALVALTAAYFRGVSAASHRQLLTRAFPVPHLRVLRRSAPPQHRPAEPLPSRCDRPVDHLDRPARWMGLGNHCYRGRDESALPQLTKPTSGSRPRRPRKQPRQRSQRALRWPVPARPEPLRGPVPGPFHWQRAAGRRVVKAAVLLVPVGVEAAAAASHYRAFLARPARSCWRAIIRNAPRPGRGNGGRHRARWPRRRRKRS